LSLVETAYETFTVLGVGQEHGSCRHDQLTRTRVGKVLGPGCQPSAPDASRHPTDACCDVRSVQGKRLDDVADIEAAPHARILVSIRRRRPPRHLLPNREPARRVL
jgi:hypothetical protein